jgi:hypothetical protein
MSENPERHCIHTHLFNDREYPRLVVVVTIGADAEIDLLWEGICLVGCGKLENTIATV